jgi:tetratricopeptide (TPR) repeat protein
LVIPRAASICAAVLWLGGACLGQAPRSAAIQSLYDKAQAALARGDYGTAGAEFRSILAIDPSRAGVHANLGTVYYAQAQYAEASNAFRKALHLQPGLRGAAAFLGMSEARQGRWEEAMPLLEEGFRDPLNKQWKLEAGLLLAEAYQRTAEPTKLQATLDALERDFPDNAEVLYITYRIHSTQAARAVANLVKSAPESARLRQITAELLEAEGDFAGAVAEYRNALEIEPKLPGARRALGVALMNKANDAAARAEAQTLFTQELALNPGDPLSEYQLGELMWIANRPADALKRFERAIELQPAFPDALVAAGKVLIALGRPSEAIARLTRAVALDPSSEVAHYRLAQALQKTGDRARAEQELAEFRKLRAAMESLRGIYRQIQENRITAQRVEQE